jgi:hypothetical protein
VLKVFLPIFTENENAFKVNENKRAGTEKNVHELLKLLGSIL